MPPNSYYRPLPWTSIFLDPTTRLEVLEGAPSFAPFSEGWALTIKRRDLLLCSFFVTSLFPDFFTSPLPPPQSPPTPSNTPPPTPTAPAHTPPTPHPESPAHSSSHPQNSKPRTHTPHRRPTILRTPTISASSYAPYSPIPPQNSHSQTPPSDLEVHSFASRLQDRHQQFLADWNCSIAYRKAPANQSEGARIDAPNC